MKQCCVPLQLAKLHFYGIHWIAANSDAVLWTENKNRNKITHVGQNCVC